MFGRVPAVPSPGVESVRLDIPAWDLQESSSQGSVWRDSMGDVLSVDVVDALDFPVPTTTANVRSYFRNMAESRGAGLIEAGMAAWRFGEAIQGVYKWPTGTGFAFTGLLAMPARRSCGQW